MHKLKDWEIMDVFHTRRIKINQAFFKTMYTFPFHCKIGNGVPKSWKLKLLVLQNYTIFVLAFIRDFYKFNYLAIIE